MEKKSLSEPDINLSMSVFDWFKPLDKVLGTIDKAVTDKDLRNQLKAEVQHAEIDLRKLAQQTYVAELNTKTIPWVDGVHKLARSILSLLTLIFGGSIILYMVHKGHQVTLESMSGILAMSGPAGIYNFVKGKGASVK